MFIEANVSPLALPHSAAADDNEILEGNLGIIYF